MRVIGGDFGGRVISAPAGVNTRPTSDRVREATFSRLESIMEGIPRKPVLDLFAGSGALGIEALSRGASSATFFERDRGAIAALRSNLRVLELTERSLVVPSDPLLRLPASALRTGPFALLFVDPPYRIDKSKVRGVIETLKQTGALSAGALVVWEHASSDTVPWPEMSFEDLGSRRYGDTTVSMARLEGGTR